jgi:hypothetical protein
MSDAPQTAKTPTDARQASMSRVVTHEMLMQRLNPTPQAAPAPAPTAEKPPVDEPKQEKTEPEQKPPEAKDDKPQGEKTEAKPEAEPHRKKSPQERIHELADKRREAEAKAEDAQRRNQELEAELRALKATAKPMDVDDRPVRTKFASDDEYIEALTDWKAKQAVADRERQNAQARREAEEAEIAEQWSRRQTAVMKDFPDYADVIGNSEIAIPNHIHRALIESDFGPQIAYYLALNPGEAKALSLMSQVRGIKRIAVLEQEIAQAEKDGDAPPAEAKAQAAPKAEAPKVPRSKAPEPIDPPRSVPSTTPAAASSYAEYKARRKAVLDAKKAA